MLLSRRSGKNTPELGAFALEPDNKVYEFALIFVSIVSLEMSRLRENERKQIEQSLASGELDGSEALKAKKLLQKVQSREVSQRQHNIRRQLDEKYTQFLKSARESGEQVKYMTKKDKKKAELVIKFNELTKANKLDKYLEKKRKRNVARDRKKMQKTPAKDYAD